MRKHIYADNAATTKLDKDAFDAMIPWLTEYYGNASQPYSFSRDPKRALSEARKTIASCINASPDEIYFTSGGTESDNWAIKGTFFANPSKKQIITSPIEHHAVLNSCKELSTIGVSTQYINVDSNGHIDSDDLISAIESEKSSLVTLMLANNEIGTIQNCIRPQIARFIHQHGALFHTDAVQAVGHIPVDVEKLGVDLLSASAHKFNGPKGIGFLYIKKGVNVHPLLNGGAQERNMRAGTENIASIVGMSVALQKQCERIVQNALYMDSLKKQLINQLKAAKISFILNGSDCLPGLISISFPGFEGETLLHRLDLMGISVSTGSACDSTNTEISHVLEAIKLDKRTAKGTIRISLGINNTYDDVDCIFHSLVKILEE